MPTGYISVDLEQITGRPEAAMFRLDQYACKGDFVDELFTQCLIRLCQITDFIRQNQSDRF
jgi:hypothetical protein